MIASPFDALLNPARVSAIAAQTVSDSRAIATMILRGSSKPKKILAKGAKPEKGVPLGTGKYAHLLNIEVGESRTFEREKAELVRRATEQRKKVNDSIYRIRKDILDARLSIITRVA